MQITKLLTPISTKEEQAKLKQFRLILEANLWMGFLIVVAVVILWSYRLIPFWRWGLMRRFSIYFLLPAFPIFVYLTHHKIPKRWQLIPLLTIVEVFLFVFLDYYFVHFCYGGIMGTCYFFLFVPLMVAAIGLEAKLVILSGVFIVILALFEAAHNFFSGGELAIEMMTYPIGVLARLAYIIIFAFFARYLAREAWQQRQARERLEQLEEERRTFVELATHNLRTPLVVLDGYLSMLQEKARNFDQQTREYLKQAVKSSTQLSTLLTQFMHILKLERGVWISEKVEVGLGAIARKVVDKYQQLAQAKGLDITLNLPQEKLLVSVNSDFVESALDILVDNAIKFNRPHGFVKISLERVGTKAIGRVEDSGIGIPEVEIEHIFQKFYRATSVLTYDYPGIGLGLYLAKLIFQKHDGDIKVTSKVGVGSTFTFELPIE